MLGLEENNQRLRFALANKIGKQLRRMPELHFYLDESLDEFFRMEKVFSDLRANNQMGSEEE
jgi:ribosome-binding factor A